MVTQLLHNNSLLVMINDLNNNFKMHETKLFIHVSFIGEVENNGKSNKVLLPSLRVSCR